MQLSYSLAGSTTRTIKQHTFYISFFAKIHCLEYKGRLLSVEIAEFQDDICHTRQVYRRGQNAILQSSY